MSITNTLYRAARLSADARAVRKGPAAVGRRIVRKSVYRSSAKATRRVLRVVGL